MSAIKCKLCNKWTDSGEAEIICFHCIDKPSDKNIYKDIERIVNSHSTAKGLTSAIAKYITMKVNPLDLQVIPNFAEADIRKRYDQICNKIDYWRKRVEKEKSYEQGYEYGLVYAEKQFRNLFKDGEGNELESKSSA